MGRPGSARFFEPTGPLIAAQTPEGTLVNQAAIRLTFTAACDADKEPSWLQKNLPDELVKAVIYPDKIGAIKTDGKGHFAISVGAIRLSAPAEARPTAAAAAAAPSAAAKAQESAVITIGLISPKEADDLLAAAAQKRAKQAREKPPEQAAAAAVTAGTTESAPPRTPPGPVPRP